MRFSVVGSDPETGQHLELVVDAPSVEDAVSIARRRQVHVMSVTPAEGQQAPAPRSTRPRSFRATTTSAPDRPGRTLRATTTTLLVVVLFTAVSYPLVTLTVGGALLVSVATFVVAPKTRSALRRVLGVWPDRPALGAAKLAALVVYGAFLVTFALEGPEAVERSRAQEAQQQTQQRAQDAAAVQQAKQLAVEVRGLLGEASTALQAGDLAKGEELARTAAALKSAPNREDAVELVGKIELATVPARALDLLAKMPESEFASFSERGQQPPSMVLGFDALDARLLENAKGQLPAATANREKRAAAEKGRAEDARRKREAEADGERARVAAARQSVHDKADAYQAILDAGNVTIVERVTAQQIGDGTWEATLTVGSLWHIKHKQVRLQDAQNLWQAWALVASPKDQDSARIRIVDHNGNEVGGSRVWGGSLIWVND